VLRTAAIIGPVVFLCSWVPPTGQGAELTAQTIQAFDRYIRETEKRIDLRLNDGKSFLWTDESPERQRSVRGGRIVTEPRGGRSTVEAPRALIHDWLGAVFIPGATLERTLALVRDYGNHKHIYRPEVADSRIIHHEGNRYKIHLRLLKKKVLTVVLNTEHDVEYFPLDGRRWHSRSYSTRIAQVQDPGKKNERELPAGKDHGFLWRLYSYWRFEERDDGVYVECQAVSLTRDVPAGLGWLIEPVIRDLPRESLENTLRATREALVSGGP
jgi:hypothetical protein